MNNFEFYTPTKIYFGDNQISKLKNEVSKYGKKVLLVYGGGSIKRNGIYNALINELRDFEIFELSGVKPNPRIDTVREGVRLCKDNQIESVVAVGGGSSMDSAKAICAAALSDEDAWDLVLNPKKINKALPLFCVLTLAATGSEMDPTGVITNPEFKDKRGFSSEYVIPKASILDPKYTFSVSKKQTASGIADIMSHIIETYFNDHYEAFVSNKIAIALLKTCIQYGKTAVEEPENYEARANIMWTSSLGINGLISCGIGKKWSCHPMQHVLGAYYDCIHGEALSILTIAWMKYILNEHTVRKFKEYGVEVWGIDVGLDEYAIAEEAIKLTHEFFISLGLSNNLAEIGVKEEDLDELALKAVNSKGGVIKGYVKLEKDDVLKIYQMCYK